MIGEASTKAMGVPEFNLKSVIRRDPAVTIRRALDQSED
jgi:hypothetical protein